MEAIQEYKSKDIRGNHRSGTAAVNIALAVRFEGQRDAKAPHGGRRLEPTDAVTLAPRSQKSSQARDWGAGLTIRAQQVKPGVWKLKRG